MAPSVREAILKGHTALGIELGSTRIKAVLITAHHQQIAVGSHQWENQFIDRTWTYSLESIWSGLQQCYAVLASSVRERYAVDLTTVGALGVSAMMHGYLAFDADDNLLTPFRTWRNTNTEEAAERLTVHFGHNIPHRWSVAHLYQAILNGEEHVPRIAHLTTLAGYVHWQLSGQKVIGVGDASGMFPIDIGSGGYDATMVRRFGQLAAQAGVDLDLIKLLPAVRTAGEPAGKLTEAGAMLLDPSFQLRGGSPMCPPEGDAGTGMVATNTIAPRTGNVSAGTSIFAMVVLEHALSQVHRELDIVTTPAGNLVAMVHCNNGASELSAWVDLFTDFARTLGVHEDPPTVFEILVRSAITGKPDCGGLLSYNYLSGEPITGLSEGRPLLVRSPDSTFDVATLMRTHLFTALATLRIGMDTLQQREGIRLDRILAHGGLFKTRGVADRFLAAALDTPVSVGDIAAEGGAWGIAVLATFATTKAEGQSLVDYLNEEVFSNTTLETVEPNPVDVAGFERYLLRFVAALPVQHAAVEYT